MHNPQGYTQAVDQLGAIIKAMTQQTKDEVVKTLEEEAKRIQWGRVLIDATVQDGKVVTVQYETKRTVKLS